MTNSEVFSEETMYKMCLHFLIPPVE